MNVGRLVKWEQRENEAIPREDFQTRVVSLEHPGIHSRLRDAKSK